MKKTSLTITWLGTRINYSCVCICMYLLQYDFYIFLSTCVQGNISKCNSLIPVEHSNEYYNAVVSGCTGSESPIGNLSDATLNFIVKLPMCSQSTEYITTLLTYQEGEVSTIH